MYRNSLCLFEFISVYWLCKFIWTNVINMDHESFSIVSLISSHSKSYNGNSITNHLSWSLYSIYKCEISIRSRTHSFHNSSKLQDLIQQLFNPKSRNQFLVEPWNICKCYIFIQVLTQSLSNLRRFFALNSRKENK